MEFELIDSKIKLKYFDIEKGNLFHSKLNNNNELIILLEHLNIIFDSYVTFSDEIFSIWLLTSVFETI